MKSLALGRMAGILATVCMTVVVVIGKVTGLLGTPPPKQITANAGRKVGVHPHAVRQEAFTVSWLAAHLGYGAATGVIYTLLRPLMPGASGGLVYGGIVWAVSYLGIMPAMGLYPAPENDSNSRMAVMISAHAVYGISLAKIEDRWMG